MRKSLLFCGLLALCAVGSAWGEVQLPALFSDNMVLQRDRPISVWGWAAPGERVLVQLADATAISTNVVQTRVTADGRGEWQAKLPARKDGEGLTLTVSGNHTVKPLTLKNLIFGDVWICSGQSNMEFTLGGAGNPDDVKTADFSKIRCVKISHLPSRLPEVDFPRKGVSGWQLATPQSAGRFTAVGFLFAREIWQQTGVPIGIIDDNWGGTRIEAWMTPVGLAHIRELDKLKASMKKQQSLASKQLTAMADWATAARYSLAENRVPPHQVDLQALWSCGAEDMALYNGMINPLLRFPIKGVLWYQGEANGDEDDIYYHKMRALIGGWRALWQQGDFPFYYVLLANWLQATNDPAGGDAWSKVRCAQTKALSIPNTGMASALDIGEAGNIHPRDKVDVGKRLALWALLRDYGKTGIVPSGPIFKAMKIEGNKICLSFDYVGAGLMVGKKDGAIPTVEVKDGKLARFAIAGDDKQWVWADAVIIGDTVLVSSDKVAHPVAVRYAFSMNPAGANLYNKNGLPATPFRTDTW